MTAKDYTAIAKIIRGQVDDALRQELAVLTTVAWELAELFASDNPRFDRERFLRACGLPDG